MAEFYEILAKASMRLSAPFTQPISDAAYVPLEYDQVTVERGGMTCDINNNLIRVASTGLYSIKFGVDGNFPGQEMLELMAFVNGVAYSSYPVVLQGRPSQKPVSVFWESTAELTDGDDIDIRGRNAESGTFDLNLQRMYFTIIKEH